jgi:hypothetical protein
MLMRFRFHICNAENENISPLAAAAVQISPAKTIHAGRVKTGEKITTFYRKEKQQ